MAPRRDSDEILRQSHRRSTKAASFARKAREKRPNRNEKLTEDDGDVLMSGYRIPTVLSSKGAIQHKFDRYAPPPKNQVSPKSTHTRDKGHGHKRTGGHYDEYRNHDGHHHERASAEEYNQRYGDEYQKHRSTRDEDEHRHSYPDKSSRRDRYAKEYHHVVTSARSRYEQDRTRYRAHHSPSRDGRYRRRYESQEYLYNRHLHSERDNSQRSTERYYHHFQRGGYSRDDNRKTSRDSYSSRDESHHHQSYNSPDYGTNFSSEGGFEGAMKRLASHAEKFLKDAHWRDREEIEAAVWKAYGDSIASLGCRRSREQAEYRPRGWVSMKGISQADDDFHSRVSRGPRDMREVRDRINYNQNSHRELSTMRSSQVVEGYRRANREYERSLKDLFGDKSSYTGSYANSSASSNSNFNAHDHPNRGRSQLFSFEYRTRSRSPSIASDSTVTARRIRQAVPRPGPPPTHHIPTYQPDPNDPMRFINVPRPRMKEQWHIPSDTYNGAAWADNRRREIETGAYSTFYPDRWFSGDSFGDATKDITSKQRALRENTTNQEPIGRECYAQDTATNPNDDRSRSHSISSQLRHNLDAFSLNSDTTSVAGSSRAGSELPDDFDLYGPPSVSSQPSELTFIKYPEQFQILGTVPVQPASLLNQGTADSGDDGSRTPRQQDSSPVESNSSTPHTLASMEYSSGNLTTVDDDCYQSSREGTPTFSLAHIMGYDPSTPGHSYFPNQSLIDLTSAPGSPNAARAHATTPSYYPKISYAPNSSRHKDTLFGEDWESSFGSVAGDYQDQSIPNGNKPNSQFMTDDEDKNIIGLSGFKEGVLVDLAGSSMRSDTETDDELDFMGVEWFAKAA